MSRNRNSGRVVKRRLLLESLENRRVFDAAMMAAFEPAIELVSTEPVVASLSEKPVEVVGFEIEAVQRPDDVSEPGPNATPLVWTGNGTWIDGTFDSNTDTDAFMVNLPALSEFTVSVGTDTETRGAAWQLLDADLQLVEHESNDFGDVYQNLNSGTYYLVVMPTDSSDTPTNYWVSATGTRVDDTADLDETATVMTLDWGIGGNIDGENDIDAFQLKLPDTDGLTIYGSHDDLTSNWSITLHHADGSVVAPTPPVDGQDASVTQYDAIAGGLYYVVVEGSASAKSDYWISVDLARPVDVPWIRFATGSGTLAQSDGGSVDDPTLMFTTTVDKESDTSVSVTNVIDEPTIDGDVIGGIKIDPIPAEDDSSGVVIKPDDIIFYTLGGSTDNEVTTQATSDPMDINRDGTLSASDVLEIIHYLNVYVSQSGSNVAASAKLVADTVSLEDAALDVSGDGYVTAADALMLINRMNVDDIAGILSNSDESSGSVSGNTSIAIDEPFETSDEGVKELALADVGSYGVVYLQIGEDGLIKAEADSESVEVAVGTDGSLSIGEDLLPAHLVTSSDGEAFLATGYVSSSDTLPGENGRFAGYSNMTVTGPDQRYIVLSVNDDGSVSALSDGRSLEVVVGDDDSLTVDGDVLPVIVRKLGDSVLLVPTSDDSSDTFVSWAGLVDDVMAQFA